MTTIEGRTLIGAGPVQPKESGERLAKEVLKVHDFYNSDGITINLKGVPSEVIISLFFVSFYSTLKRESEELAQHFSGIVWEVDYLFQKDNIKSWTEKYKPEYNWVTSNVRKIKKPESSVVLLHSDLPPLLAVTEDEKVRNIEITIDVAEVLIAEGFPFET